MTLIISANCARSSLGFKVLGKSIPTNCSFLPDSRRYDLIQISTEPYKEKVSGSKIAQVHEHRLLS